MADYDTYYGKHCARYYGWLPAAKNFQKHTKKKSLKYFTLCAEQAIDVFMFESEKIVVRDKNRRLPNVVVCEEKRETAGQILSLLRPPIQEAIVVGPLEKILTFEDNDLTRGRSPDEDVRNRHIREMLRLKGLNQRLLSFFPFDVINFDTLGNMLNQTNEANRVLFKAFKKIFQLQKGVPTFLLFVTIPISDIDSNFKSSFEKDFEANIAKFPEILDSLASTVHTISYDKINENKQVAISVAKSVVSSIAKENGWASEHKGIYIYENRDLRKMLSAVIKFSRTESVPDKSLYVQDIIRVIQDMPDFYSYSTSIENQAVRRHLKKVIKYREKIKKESTS